jgi:hypothetical protein
VRQRGGPSQHSAGRSGSNLVLNRFKNTQMVQIKFEFLQTWLVQKIPSPLQKFEIKYGWKEFELRINFSYRNISRFEIEFELKFR